MWWRDRSSDLRAPTTPTIRARELRRLVVGRQERVSPDQVLDLATHVGWPLVLLARPARVLKHGRAARGEIGVRRVDADEAAEATDLRRGVGDDVLEADVDPLVVRELVVDHANGFGS